MVEVLGVKEEEERPGSETGGAAQSGASEPSRQDETSGAGQRATRPVKSEGAPGYAFRARCVQCRGKPC